MLDHPAFPVIFFLLSGFAFGIALLYALARPWEKALRPAREDGVHLHRKMTKRVCSSDTKYDGPKEDNLT